METSFTLLSLVQNSQNPIFGFPCLLLFDGCKNCNSRIWEYDSFQNGNNHSAWSYRRKTQKNETTFYSLDAIIAVGDLYHMSDSMEIAGDNSAINQEGMMAGCRQCSRGHLPL